jgi:hypothetical protein
VQEIWVIHSLPGMSAVSKRGNLTKITTVYGSQNYLPLVSVKHGFEFSASPHATSQWKLNC